MATIQSMTVALRASTENFRRGMDRASRRVHDFQGDVSDRLHRLRRSFGSGGRSMGRAFTSALGTSLSAVGGVMASALRGMASKPFVKGAAIAAGAVLGGALVTAFTIALGGLAVVGLSYYILKDVPKVKKALAGMKEDVKSVFKDAAKPMAEPLAQAFRDVGKIIEDLKPEFEEMFETVASSGIMKNLTGGLKGFLEGFMPGFNDMLKDMKPVFEGLEDFLTKVGEGLGGFFRELGKSAPEAKLVLQDFGSILKETLIWAGRILGFFTKLYAKSLEAQKAIGAAWDIFKVTAKDAWESTKETFWAIIDWFKELPGRVIKYLLRLKSNITGTLSATRDLAIKKSKELVTRVVLYLAALPGRAWRALSSWAGKMGRRAIEAGRRLVDGVKRKLSDAVDKVRGLPGRAVEALGNIGSKLYYSGKSLISGFIDGIWAKIGEVRDAASSVVSAARDYFPFSPAKEGPFSGKGWTLYSGRSLIDGFRTGIDQGIPGLRKDLDGIYGEIPSMRANVSGVVRAGRSNRQRVQVDFVTTGANEEMKALLRKIVQVDGRGNVQYAFGTGR